VRSEAHASEHPSLLRGLALSGKPLHDIDQLLVHGASRIAEFIR
jgi:hypothetical protein